MTPFRVQWHPAAETTLLKIPDWHVAERVARAVDSFALYGMGNPERASATTWRLRCAGYAIIFSVNVQARELLVWSVVKTVTG